MSDRPLRQRGVTQKDIAKALNLSKASVAFALNPKLQHKLPPETVAYIQAKAEELDYRPQQLARILRKGRSYTIAMLFVSSNFQPGQERIKELARQAIRARYQMVAVDLDWFDGDERAAQDYLLGASVEGVIFYNVPSALENGWIEFLAGRGVQSISFNKTNADVDQAYPDMKEAFKAITQHHIAQGSTAPLLLLPGRRSSEQQVAGHTMLLRVAGFLAALDEAGGTLEMSDLGPEMARYLGIEGRAQRGGGGIIGRISAAMNLDGVSDVFAQGARNTFELLKRKVPFDALICSNDSVAAGALSSLKEARVPVPGVVTLSGADNAPFSRFCGEPLTTIQQISESVVEWGIGRLVEQIECRGVLPVEHKVFPCEVIIRRSTLRTGRAEPGAGEVR